MLWFSAVVLLEMGNCYRQGADLLPTGQLCLLLMGLRCFLRDWCTSPLLLFKSFLVCCVNSDNFMSFGYFCDFFFDRVFEIGYIMICTNNLN